MRGKTGFGGDALDQTGSVLRLASDKKVAASKILPGSCVLGQRRCIEMEWAIQPPA
jgi:hypothetical protein